MPGQYPPSDPAFDAWQLQAYTKVNAAPADYGLVAGDVVPLTAGKGDWDTDYPAATAAKAAAG